MKARVKKIMSLVLCGTVIGATLAGCGNTKKSDKGSDEIDFLSVWQGDSVRQPDDPDNNPVLKKIMEETGVKINVRYNNVTEVERLNTMFAAGEEADLVSAAMWGMDDTSTNIIKKAAKEGMLMPLNDLIEKYGSNVKKSLTNGLAEDFIKYDLEDEDFNGEHYFIPTGVTPVENRIEIDTTLQGLYIREDIMKALNLDVSSIRTSEDVYELLKKIKAGGFKDIMGGNVIPGGLLSSGGGTALYYRSYVDSEGGFTGLYLDDEGKVRDDFFNPLIDKQTLFLRKLFTEDLLDTEAIGQTSAKATEKIVNGKYAIVPAKYGDIQTWCASTLYETNPEMKYVPLPPLEYANGSTDSYKLKGTGGSSVLFIPASSKKSEQVMKVLNYMHTEEGTLLAEYGIEGEHYQVDSDGKIEPIGEYATLSFGDKAKKAGLYTYFRLAGNQNPKKFKKEASESDEIRAVREMLQVNTVYKDGIRLSYIEQQNPKTADIRQIKSNNNMDEAKQKAWFASSDAEALKYLNDLRQQILNAGIEEVWKSVDEYIAANPDQEYLY